MRCCRKKQRALSQERRSRGTTGEGRRSALIATGKYPQLAALVDEVGMGEVWHRVRAVAGDEGRFERNLSRILDGIAASLPRPG